MNEFLQIKELNVRLGEFCLADIELTLEPNEYLVMLGPTGCGKTTLLRVIAGFYRVKPRQLYLEGEDIALVPVHRRRIGYVAQTTDLFPHLTVEGNVLFGLHYAEPDARVRRDRLEYYLDLLELAGLRDRNVMNLSGGESKKVAIARSLATSPRLLLLDEPLGMLDHNARKDVLDILMKVHEALGTTTIHVTHDRSEAWAVGGTCAVMGRGRIHQVAPAEEIFNRPADHFVAQFLGGVNIFEARFDGSSAAKLAWGECAMARKPAFTKGYVQIRPEKIRLARGGDAQARGILKRDTLFGAYRELVVEMTGGAELVAHIPPDAVITAGVGDEISLTWKIEAVHPIASDSAAGKTRLNGNR